MNLLRSISWCLVLLLAAACGRKTVSPAQTSAAARQEQPTAAPDTLDRFMQAAMEKHHIPGTAVAVIRNGAVEKIGVYGMANLSWQQPVTTETQFQLASATKPFAGFLLGVLLQEGTLRLDDPVSKYLDSLPAVWQPITIYQLAAHQSGIKLVDLDKPVTAADALALARELPMEYEPGTKEFYVSSDYLLLQLVFEKVTGLPYPEALYQKVLRPLGMEHTHFDGSRDDGLFRTKAVLEQVSEVYGWENDRHVISDMRFPSWFAAAGGIHSSIGDLAKLMQALQENTLLKPETKATLLAKTRLLDGKETMWGLGFVVEDYQGHRLVGHTGGPALGDLMYFPDHELSIVVLTNRRGGYPPYLGRSLARNYIPGLEEPKF